MRQRAVEVIFCCFEDNFRCPQKPFCTRRGRDGGRIIPGKEARLQLADPVPALGIRQIRVGGEPALDPLLVELAIVKGTECRRQSAQCPDQHELRGIDVNGQAEPHLLHKFQAMLGFALRFVERIADLQLPELPRELVEERIEDRLVQEEP